MDMWTREREGGMNRKSSTDVHAPPYVKTESGGKLPVARELSSVLCDDREGWEEAQEGGDIHTRIADSICCVAETNTHCKAIIL